MTQRKRVLDHLRKSNITSSEAFNLYGITRLSAVIFELRAEGFDIGTTMVKKKNRYGETCYVAEYELMEGGL